MILKINAKDESMMKPAEGQDYREAQSEVTGHNNSSMLFKIT